jgi:mono/diheme cytochrome c family protein
MRTHKSALIFLAITFSMTLAFAAAGDGLWMLKVPDKQRVRTNPLDHNPDAALAGAKLFRQNCASCHGDDANGKDHHPPLRSERIRNASPGELEWILTNGSMKNGMPSWSRLPEPQRWQLVSFLKSLQ